ncbi:MAG: hypothetical protein SFX72_06975 [Isosphaeraceae bacterium]|nr:hypothetical protein [Isosphaeraceae bacterium]
MPLWVPLTTQQSRDYLAIHVGGKLADYPELAEMVRNKTLDVESVVKEGGTCDPAAFMKFVINAKSRTRPTISTDLGADCGGYASSGAYVWTIDMPVFERDWRAAIPTISARPTSFWPKLYLDAETLADATHIAVRSSFGVKELAYLTPLPRAAMVRCTRNGDLIVEGGGPAGT